MNVAEIFVGINDTLGHPVATNDTAEDIDEDRFYSRIFQDDFKSGFHRLRIGRTAYIQEVGRFTTAEFDHIHSGHGQTSPIHHTTHIAIQFHKVQVELTGFHFSRIFLCNIAQGRKIGMAYQGVIIQVHLTVNGHDFIISRFEQRVNFQHGAIQPYISIVKIGHKFYAILKCVSAQSQVECNFTRLESLKSTGRVYPFFKNLFGGIMGYFLDIHTAFGTVHDYILTLGTVEQDGEIEFLTVTYTVIIHILGHQYFIHHFTGWSGLQGYQGSSQYFFREVCDIFNILSHFHTVDPIFFNGSFTAAACMDLSFYNGEAAAELVFDLAVGFFRFMYCTAGKSFLHRNIVFFQ